MKKYQKIVALFLCICLSVSVMVPVAYAGDTKVEKVSKEDVENFLVETSTLALSKTINFLINDVLLGAVNVLIPNLSSVRDDATELDDTAFYAGDEEFLSTDAKGGTWSLGFASESILPDDFGEAKFKYARGSYIPDQFATETYLDDDGNPEDLKVRTIVLDDGTGRGSVVISSVDCVGISNTDVLKIRAGVKDAVDKAVASGELKIDPKIKSINISATHTHMSIDTQGAWNKPITTILNNLFATNGIGKAKTGVDEDYLNKIIESTKKTVIDACANKKAGNLEYTKIDISNYVKTKTISKELDTNMYKLYFLPADGSTSTVIASFGCHPEISSYNAISDTRLTADFVYYMEKLINDAGSNFMYIQGNVGVNSSGRGDTNDNLKLENNHEAAIRYGYEMAYICLGASMTEEQRIALNNATRDKLGVKTGDVTKGYTPWYDSLKDCSEYTVYKVNPVLNIRSERIKIEVESNMSRILLKLGLASNDLSYDRETRKYYTTTEIGYMQLGDELQVFFSPGELFSELVVGGYGLKYTKDYKSLRETYGENVIVFDLMNDAAGYVCPDETYSVIDTRHNNSEKEWGINTWCLLVSMGKNTASTLMEGYEDLVKSVNCDSFDFCSVVKLLKNLFTILMKGYENLVNNVA